MVFKKLCLEQEKLFKFAENIDMKNYVLVLVLLFPFGFYAQNRFTRILPETEYISTANELKNFRKYDFSPVISGLENNVTYGVIGSSYKRIHIKITDVVKDLNNVELYHVKGKSKVGNNIESFEGTISLHTVKEIKPRTLDETTVSLPAAYEGVITGVYKFNEPTDRKHSGVFEGTYQAMFQIVEEDNKVYYNDLDLYRDSYINNVFQGFWTDYQTKEAKICKWADFRVPNVPADFDLGAGEFSPNEKYNNNGWKTYNDAYLHNDKKALDEEEAVWWE